METTDDLYQSTVMSTPEPLEEFFARFASLNFGYRRSKTAHSNLKRLRKVSGWDENSHEWKAARMHFGDALVKQFNFIFGTGNDLESWQKLCAFIDIKPVPDTIKDCRSVRICLYRNICPWVG